MRKEPLLKDRYTKYFWNGCNRRAYEYHGDYPADVILNTNII